MIGASVDRPIVYGVTVPLSARAFLTGQLNLLAAHHPGVHLVYGPDSAGPVDQIDTRIAQHVVPVRRNPSPIQDLTGILHLVRLLRRLRPGVVVMGTPKMGLLGLVAALITRTPRRVYIMYGLRLQGAQGIGRAVLWIFERVTIACATEVLALSASNREEAIRLGLVRPERIEVLGAGSIGGVDLTRFRPPNHEQREGVRQELGIPPQSKVVGFLGRLTADKGLEAMAEAWPLILSRSPNAWLVLFGPDEATGDGDGDLVEALRRLPNVILAGPVDEPARAFAAMDVQLLLTKREGFGMVLIEGAACGVPSVATRVNGTVDAIADQETGVLVNPGDVRAAASAVSAYLESPELRGQHSRAGLARVEASFDAQHVNGLWAARIAGDGRSD